MELSKFLMSQIREMQWVFLPTPRVKREEFMDKVRERVDYYKPKIEDKTGIRLGKVQVKDNKEWIYDATFHDVSQKAAELAWENGRPPNEGDINFICRSQSIAFGLTYFPIGFYNMMRGADFRHFNNTIYVPFNYMNRFIDFGFKRREEKMDYGVVHELSHTLWDKIAGKYNSNGSFRGRRLWFEGFATYCTEEYFSEFYPEGTKFVDVVQFYRDGMKKVSNVVNERGEEFLLEIPKRWRELKD